MKLCDYGCGKEAKYKFKNGKWCCSKNHKSCPSCPYTAPLVIPKVECPHCNKLISKISIKRHINSCIKNNYCLQCGKETKNPKFCSTICSGLYNNKNSEKLKQFQDNKRKNNKCLYCNKDVSNKFCNNTCKTLFKRNQTIKLWLEGTITGNSENGHATYVKYYLLEKYNNKCSKCGWSQINSYTQTLPLEVEHIDGNPYNNTPENVILLCPNCHSLTKTYRGANSGNGRRSYLKKYYIKK